MRGLLADDAERLFALGEKELTELTGSAHAELLAQGDWAAALQAGADPQEVRGERSSPGSKCGRGRVTLN